VEAPTPHSLLQPNKQDNTARVTPQVHCITPLHINIPSSNIYGQHREGSRNTDKNLTCSTSVH